MPDNNDFAQFLPEIDVKDGLRRLRDNKKLFQTLLKSFKARQMVDELKGAIESGDFTKTAQAAHAIKGSSSNLGLSGLTGITATIEAEGKAGTPSAGHIDELEDIAQKTIDKINTILTNGLG